MQTIPKDIRWMWVVLPVLTLRPLSLFRGFPLGSDRKESACSVGVPGLIPGLGRSPGEGNGNPLQYSCLENPVDRGAWQATVHEVTELDMTEWLIYTHTHTHIVLFLIFWGISILFSIVAAPIYILTNNIWGFSFLHIFSNTYGLFDNMHTNGYEMISHCGFYFHFSNI